jgi:hypothetical protein
MFDRLKKAVYRISQNCILLRIIQYQFYYHIYLNYDNFDYIAFVISKQRD